MAYSCTLTCARAGAASASRTTSRKFFISAFLGELILRIDKRHGNHSGGAYTVRRFYFQVGGHGQRQHGVADVFLQPRRMDARSDVSAAAHRIARHVEIEPRAVDLDPRQLLPDSLLLDAAQCGAPDELGRLVELDHPLEPYFVGTVLERHVDAVVEDAGFDAADVGGAGRRDAVGLAGRHDTVPQLGAARRLEEIDLVAELAAPAGARHQHPDRVQPGLEAMIGAEPRYP